jgi:hypothetical protein
MLVVLPIIMLILLSAFDIVARVDTGISKLFWLLALLMLPGLGLFLYWLFRPKDFQPLVETRDEALPVSTLRQDRRLLASCPAPAAGATPRLTPALQGGADAESGADTVTTPRESG